jgi:SAM-dependent methyltransferase
MKNTPEIIYKYSRKAELEDFARREGLYPYEAALGATHFKPGGRLLTLGCGAGRESRGFADLGYRVVGVDVVPQMIELARKLDGGRQNEFQVADITELPLPDKSFDAVTMSAQLIDHLPQREQKLAAISEASRVLKPSGQLLLSFYNNIYRPGLRAYGWWLYRGFREGAGGANRGTGNIPRILMGLGRLSVLRITSDITDGVRYVERIYNKNAIAPGWRRINRVSTAESSGWLWHCAPKISEIERHLKKCGLAIVCLDDTSSYSGKPTPRPLVRGAYTVVIVATKSV